ncbi:hypothetical protein ONZ45_g8157 [Pleurotus djamor]|nr:hypothetical protein ONZ45_g8157 [Pleurotus djamor]
MAGLYSALLLQSKGVSVHVFEANDRIGGRIWTHRFNGAPNQFFEAGAMRVPKSSFHQPVLDLISFVNSKLGPDHIETIPYILHSTGNRVLVNNQRKEDGSYFSLAELGELTAERLGFELPSPFADKTAHQLLEAVIRPFIKDLRLDFASAFKEILKYDDLSFRTYLRAIVKWPAEVIDFAEVMLAQTNQYALSFPEVILQNLDFSTLEWFTIKGGMDRLPKAMAMIIGPQNISLNARVTGLHELDDGRVTLRFDNPAIPVEASYDRVILALPPAGVRMIQDRPKWSPLKEAAIRSIHFEPLYKLGLRFKTRFWENISNPSFGGQSITDLSSRWVVYPSNGIGEQGPGVLLMYSWMTDALAWLPLTRREQIERALDDLAKLYGKEVNIHEEFIEGEVVSWAEKWSCGDAMFLPGQYTSYSAVAAAPERNVYFAGEHLSMHHTWISGAIESALAAVRGMMEDDTMELLS